MRDRAEAVARERWLLAQTALEERSFSEVAAQYGDAQDQIGRGQPFALQLVTDLERQALLEPLEGEGGQVPRIIELSTADGSTFHLLACERVPTDRAPAWERTRRLRDRRVYHIQLETREEAERAQAELAEALTELAEDDPDAPWPKRLDAFKRVARERSQAPGATKGGALGRVGLNDAVRGYGSAFLERACYRDGDPLERGARVAFRSAAGFHIVWVTGVQRAPERVRLAQTAEALLNGTDWR